MDEQPSQNPFDAFSKAGSTFALNEAKQYEFNVTGNSSTPLFNALAEDRKKEVMELALELNYQEYERVLSFGRAAQEKMTQFTSLMLKHTQHQDVQSTGQLLNELLVHLEKINPDGLLPKEQSFFEKLFQKKQPSIAEQMSQYTRLKVRIDRLSIQLEHSQQQLLKDYQMLDELYHINEDYFNQINTYIAAIEIKLDHLRTIELPRIQKQAAISGNPLDEHAVRDLLNQIEWLDKRKYDLEISREISIQSAPQIRLIQKTGQMLIEKIQTSVMATIPLWQSQIAMILQMNTQRRMAESERKIISASEKLARKNEGMYKATKTATTSLQSQNKVNLQRFRDTQLQLLRDIEDTLSIQQQASDKLLETNNMLK